MSAVLKGFRDRIYFDKVKGAQGVFLGEILKQYRKKEGLFENEENFLAMFSFRIASDFDELYTTHYKDFSDLSKKAFSKDFAWSLVNFLPSDLPNNGQFADALGKVRTHFLRGGYVDSLGQEVKNSLVKAVKETLAIYVSEVEKDEDKFKP